MWHNLNYEMLLVAKTTLLRSDLVGNGPQAGFRFIILAIKTNYFNVFVCCKIRCKRKFSCNNNFRAMTRKAG